MKFKLDSPPIRVEKQIDHSSSIVLLGSCFSDEIAHKLKQAGFRCLSNPFGTLFHPVPLANTIIQSSSASPKFDFFNEPDASFCWDASHALSGESEIEIRKTIAERAENLKSTLENASHLFITLGSSWAYEEKELGKIVANCHKQPGNRFNKKLTAVSEMLDLWLSAIRKIKQINPEIAIIFTVSPVRHSKDGLAENNRSKARLFELISQLEENLPLGYFPSYEIVLDELRDYRFYASDLVHPSADAIQYVWEKWLAAFCTEDTQKLVQQVLNLRKLDAHRSLNSAVSFENEKREKIQSFLAANPAVVW